MVESLCLESLRSEIEEDCHLLVLKNWRKTFVRAQKTSPEYEILVLESFVRNSLSKKTPGSLEEDTIFVHVIESCHGDGKAKRVIINRNNTDAPKPPPC